MKQLNLHSIYLYGVELYWIAGTLAIFINVFYGTGQVFYNAFLPLLVKSHPEYLERKRALGGGDEGASLVEEADRLGNWISARGFMAGYAAGVLGLVLGSLLILAMKGSEVTALKIGIALSGVWCLVFVLYTAMHLQTRPGNASTRTIEILTQSL